jgi:hypothetical protein
MATIKLTNKQLSLVQKALDFYSRVGSLQFEEIIHHPTIDSSIEDQFSPHRKFQIGDHTMRGEIVEIGEGFIKTKGTWGKGEEIKTWTDVEKIKFSPDWDKVHRTRDEIKIYFNRIKFLISGQDFTNGNYGIYNEKVDETCREAYDMLQVIRHEFWKANPNHSDITVDSSTHLSHPDQEIKVELDNIKDIRKQKLNKLNT